MTLSLPEAAAYLGLHFETVRKRAKAGIIKGSKPGKRWRFRQEALDAYLIALEAKGEPCRSIVSGASGTSTSPLLDSPDFESRLEQMIGGKRRNTTTRSARNSGAKASSAKVLPFKPPGAPHPNSGPKTGPGRKKTSTASAG